MKEVVVEKVLKNSIIFLNSLEYLYLTHQICSYDNFIESINKLIEYVKSSAPIKEADEILIPNELENRNREQRLRNGIEIEEDIWNMILIIAKEFGINLNENDKIVHCK